MGAGGLPSQLHRRLDLVVEQFVKIGDEILGWALLYDVADLVREWTVNGAVKA